MMERLAVLEGEAKKTPLMKAVEIVSKVEGLNMLDKRYLIDILKAQGGLEAEIFISLTAADQKAFIESNSLSYSVNSVQL